MENKMKKNSSLMRLLQKINLEGIAWSARRIHCPVNKNALVLDIGSGDNPYPRANILLDKYEKTYERYFKPLIKDRPLVFADMECMPFKNKIFDFAIASHVLEHTANPDLFLRELVRVAKAGYIETPNGFIEKINPYRFHRLEVFNKNGTLEIYKKPSWRPENELVDMYENSIKDKKFIKFMEKHPEPFYTRYYWKDEINYIIKNPEINANWLIKMGELSPTKKSNLRKITIKIMKYLFSQNARNKKLNLLEFLRCIHCNFENLEFKDNQYFCPKCSSKFEINNGIPLFLNNKDQIPNLS